MDAPKAATSRPVLVDDEMYEESQHLRPHETERLIGMSGSDTEGNGVSAKERLKCIGNSWDMNVINMLFSYSALATRTPPQSIQPRSSSTAIMVMLAEEMATSIPDVGELTAKQLTTQAILVALTQEAPDQLAEVLMQADSGEQTMYLALLKDYYVNAVGQSEYGPVLDSGSSKHLSPTVYAPNPEQCKSLSGYDNSKQWTEGNGYLPLLFKDLTTGEDAQIDVEDVDQLSKVSSRIFSMGKFIRLG